MECSYNVINNPTGLGDFDLTNRYLNILGAPKMKFIGISGFAKVVAAAEVLQVSTVTFVAANNTTYRWLLQQTVQNENGNDIEKSLIVTYISDSTATAAEINAAFAAQVTKMGFKITPTSAGSVTTLTAQAGYPIFTLAAIENVTTATTTAGVKAVGTAAVASAEMLEERCHNTGTEGFTSATYTEYEFTWGEPTTPAFNIIERNTFGQIHHLFVNDADAQYAAFDAGLINLMSGGTEASATTANPEDLGLV